MSAPRPLTILRSVLTTRYHLSSVLLVTPLHQMAVSVGLVLTGPASPVIVEQVNPVPARIRPNLNASELTGPDAVPAEFLLETLFFK